MPYENYNRASEKGDVSGKDLEHDVNPLDRNETLSKWGFDSNKCQKCNVSNSDIGGHLIQCGKCKKAYYCSTKCFNSDLPEHQKHCKTSGL
jgi:hypothetical protein